MKSSAPKLLLCSAWQNVNIGDIAHTPGALALLEKYLPETSVTLWAWKPLSAPAETLIRGRFPRVRIVTGTVTPDGAASNPELAQAMDDADFLLHGSGPAMLAWQRAEAFAKRTGRGFGIHGVTYGLYGIPERETLSRARFAFFRDPVSLARAKREGVNAPLMGIAPDTAFAFDQRDDVKAGAFLRANELKDRQFLCCLSRLRNTPYWEVPGANTPRDAAKHARNEERKAADHQPLLDAIIAATRQTTLKVLVCPEDETQMRVTKENLVDRLPTDVRDRVVWRETFWLPDEALAVYVRSAGLFGSEMHSPIMSIAHGVPAIVCRWAEQSTKGYMWQYIGLGDWLFDLDSDAEARKVASAVLQMAQHPGESRAKAERARDIVNARFAETMDVVRREVMSGYDARRMK